MNISLAEKVPMSFLWPLYQKHGHSLATCYQILGFPNKHVKKFGPTSYTSKSGPPPSTITNFFTLLILEQLNKLFMLIAKERFSGSSVPLVGTTLTYLSPCWIIDSGASNHICINLSLFSSYFSIHKNITLQLPNG